MCSLRLFKPSLSRDTSFIPVLLWHDLKNENNVFLKKLQYFQNFECLLWELQGTATKFHNEFYTLGSILYRSSRSCLWNYETVELSWRTSLSYRNQSIYLLCKSSVWFLYIYFFYSLFFYSLLTPVMNELEEKFW